MKGTCQILISGFGGQGALFAGKFLAHVGLMQNLEVSWLPSYGPEMRGGTASCSVILSETPIGSPIITHPDVLVAMNLPSMDRYEDAVVPGGLIVYDSALITRAPRRQDVRCIGIPASRLAGERQLGNMILVGKLLQALNLCSDDVRDAALDHVVSARHADLKEVNRQALQTGADQ